MGLWQRMRLEEARSCSAGLLELMTSYWPTALATQHDPVVAERMNSLPKVVFSRTLDKASWNNTKLVKGAWQRKYAK